VIPIRRIAPHILVDLREIYRSKQRGSHRGDNRVEVLVVGLSFCRGRVYAGTLYLPPDPWPFYFISLPLTMRPRGRETGLMLESFINGVEAAVEAVPATMQGPEIALAWQIRGASATFRRF